MQATEILQTLSARGAVVTLNGDRLTVTPRRVLDDELREELRRLKPELLELLSRASSGTSASNEVSSTQQPSAPVPPLRRPRWEGVEFDAALGLWRWRGGIIWTRDTSEAYRRLYEAQKAARQREREKGDLQS